MYRIRAVLLGVAAMVAVGCIQGERHIRVEADGSGRVEDTVKPVGEFAEMMQGFEAMDEESTPEEKLAEKEEKARAAAAKMGPGVSLVSYEVAEDGTEKTVYAFEDISKIKITDTPTPPGADEAEGEEGAQTDAFSFRLERGGDETTLVVVNAAEPEASAAEPKEPPSAEEKEQMVGMFKGMFGGARVTTLLSVGGEILETSSPHRDGSTVTLLDIDFDTLMSNPESLEAIATSPERPTRATMSEIEGITVFSDPELTVRFRK
jgi:hypothetical protein